MPTECLKNVQALKLEQQTNLSPDHTGSIGKFNIPGRLRTTAENWFLRESFYEFQSNRKKRKSPDKRINIVSQQRF